MNDRIVGIIFACGAAALALFWFNLWAWFGAISCAILVLGLALGYGPARRAPAIRWSLAGLLLAYLALLGGITLAGAQTGLVLGFPPATALLIYGIWPLPLVAGLVYALVFRTSVLPEDKLQKFLAEHPRREPPR